MREIGNPTSRECGLIWDQPALTGFFSLFHMFRSAENWRGEAFTDFQEVVEFRSVKQTMTVAEIYEDIFKSTVK